jgi:hypothetical protein
VSLVRQCSDCRNGFVKLNIQNIIKSLFMLFIVIGYILVIIRLITSSSPPLVALQLVS